MRRLSLAALVALAFATPVLQAAQPLDLETIMADPDWIGQPVEQPYWSLDSRHLYFALKHDGSPVRDWYGVDPAGGHPALLPARQAAAVSSDQVFDKDHHQAAFISHGVLYLQAAGQTAARQISVPPEPAQRPQFSADGQSLQYLQGDHWLSYSLHDGSTRVLAVLKFADDPGAPASSELAQQQLQLFTTLRQIQADRKAQDGARVALAEADPTRSPRPFWLGDKIEAVDSALSPDGRWLLLVVQPKGHADGKAPFVTHYVTDSGYAESEPARTYVGRADPAPQSLILLDLAQHQVWPLTTSDLPGIKDDPLAALRAQTQQALRAKGEPAQAEALKAPAVRPVIVSSGGREIDGGGMQWSRDGRQLAIELRAIDNKDRWIASVDLAGHRLVSQHRLTDKAWINWSFNDFGWLPDGRSLWFLSEQDGYSQLYLKPLQGAVKALTHGRFELSQPQLSHDGRWFYVLSNQVAPYSYDVYRVAVNGGDLQRLTSYQGTDGFVLSPDDRSLAVLHSSAYVPSQLSVVPAAGGAPHELTDTVKPAYRQRSWIKPQIVGIPSSHGAGTIYAKFYGPATRADGSPRPAVIFIHGAGYLQDVTEGYSPYFREQMFNNLLVQQGFVVLDMDYRASAGYGRDWRTAIYRQMGHPELEDLEDGKSWLVQHQGVDPKRVGVYGGSYGGFMTLIALLRAPGEFAAGAALRPVTDWNDYNHEYTSNILNDPQLDPTAYAISSPIQYADHLQDPLLIEHGLIDNNVLASDSIRLYQRFVELHKRNFWISLYPMERHGFVHPDSWFDEYRRIDELFQTWLKPRPAPTGS
ncbi:S9 family peptidase [Frateuria aurantia]